MNEGLILSGGSLAEVPLSCTIVTTSKPAKSKSPNVP